MPSTAFILPAASPALRISTFTPTTTTTTTTTTPAPSPAHPRSRPSSLRIPPTAVFSLDLDLPSFFTRTDHVSLPQHDDPSTLAARRDQLTSARADYDWDDRTTILNAALLSDLPFAEWPSVGWLEGILPVLAGIQINSRINASEAAARTADHATKAADYVRSQMAVIAGQVLGLFSDGKFGPNSAVEAARKIQGIGGGGGVIKGPGTVRQHQELFENIQLDVVAKEDKFLGDDIFAWYRTAGPNPMRLAKCGVGMKSVTTGEIISGEDTTVEKLFPELTDAIVRGIKGFEADSLAEMTAQNRLYFVSYPEFDGVPTGLDFDTKQVKENYLYAPTCLLAVPKDRLSHPVGLLPLAIRCEQNNTSTTHPMFTANVNHTDALVWHAAKTTVQVADSVMHQAVYHLGRTHLVMEVFICATHRALASSHPVYRLLKAHFYGTAFINSLAAKLLINPGGTIDSITAPDVRHTQTVSAAAVSGPGTNFNELFVDVDLERRGVVDSDVLHFPYRDDALALWNAILTWVEAYIGAYYKSDADVVADTELANWCHELTDTDKGCLRGFGDDGNGQNRITTVGYLCRVVAHAVFTATAQHAAVNFPQGTLMQFAPAMPLAGYMPAPDKAKAGQGEKPLFESIDDLSRKMYPPLGKSELQLTTAETIGTKQYGVLGDYGRSLEFAPDEVSDAMESFQMELGVIDGDVQRRNKEEKKAGLPAYKHLAPKNIPNSINV